MFKAHDSENDGWFQVILSFLTWVFILSAQKNSNERINFQKEYIAI